jgi:hypothetical protein
MRARRAIQHLAPPNNELLLLPAPLSEAAGSLRSPAAFFVIVPQQNCER